MYYTDGAYSNASGIGGCAVVRGTKLVYLGGGVNTDNNRMEGLAILAALKDSQGSACTIYTDSLLWVKILTVWAPNIGQRCESFQDLIQSVHELYEASDSRVIWVRGHNDNVGNALADRWAGTALKMTILKV